MVSLVFRTTSGGAAFQPVGMVSTFSSVVRRENLIGLWKGISPVSFESCEEGPGVYSHVAV